MNEVAKSLQRLQRFEIERTRNIMSACCRAVAPSLKKERIMVPTAVPVGYGRL